MSKSQLAIVSGAFVFSLIAAAFLALVIVSGDAALIGVALLGLAFVSAGLLCTGLIGFGLLLYRRTAARSARAVARRALLDALQMQQAYSS